MAIPGQRATWGRRSNAATALAVIAESASEVEAAEVDVAESAVSGNGDLESIDRPYAERHRALIFAIVSIALFMGSMDGTIVSTAIPRIGDALHARLNWLGWTITIYQLGQILALPLAGKISDQFGRKRVFVLSIVLFTVSSLLCGLSTSIFMLMPLRFLQALGGGAFMPSATGIVADAYGKDRDRAIGMFTSIFPIGGIVGPVFGGLITGYWSWRGIFFINVPIGIVLVFLAVHYLPNKAPTSAGRLDYRGVSLMCLTIVLGMLAIANLGEKNGSFTDPMVIAPALGSVLFGYLFLRHAKTAADPFIPMRLLRGKGFLTMNVLNWLYGTTAFGFAALVPLYAENRYRISITTAGTVLSARAIGMIAVAAVSAMMLRRTGYRLPMAVGFTAIGVGLLFLSFTPHGISAYWWLALFSMLTGLGMGTAGPATNNATLQLAPDQVAAIAGLRGMFRQSGGILYVSVATALLARSTNPGITQAHLFLAQALVIPLLVGLVYLVPEHRGQW